MLVRPADLSHGRHRHAGSPASFMVSQNQRSETRTEEQRIEGERRLRLLGSPEPDLVENRPPRARVSWTDDTVDNEHLNRKKSKICCIFHPSKEFNESSEEELSDPSSSSESDSDSDAGEHCSHGHRHRRPNAYERLPKLKQ